VSGGQTFNITFQGDTTVTAVAVTSAFVGITEAYSFNGGGDSDAITGAISGSYQGLNGNATDANASFEIWFKADSVDTAGNSQVLFETGGATDGMAIYINGTTVNYFPQDNGTSGSNAQVSFDLASIGIDPTAEFVQLVATIDLNGDAQLYVNGVLVDTEDASALADWDGGDGAGIGQLNSGTPEGLGTTAPFVGDIAKFTFYESDLSDSEVLDNFTAVAGLAVTAVNGSAISVETPIDIGDGTLMIAADGSYMFTPDTGFFRYRNIHLYFNRY
jgi:hypothetical protein